MGYPPRLLKKEYRGTIYSLNLLPFGAFVRFPDENGVDDQTKYSHQPVGKRFWIAMAGVISFWILAIVLLTVVLTIGTRINIEDSDVTNLINPRVTIIGVQPKSPAAVSGLMPGDNIVSMAVNDNSLVIEKVKDVQGFVSGNLKNEIILVLERGDKMLEVSLKPRENPQNGEGPMGIILSKTTIKKTPFYRAPVEAISNVGRLTVAIINGYYNAIVNLFRGVPTGVEPMGPIGIIGLASQAGKLGVSYFMQFIAMICLYLAVFNLLPIP
ncbi:MAG: M50 family metallopeptidase, partial [bacterium]